ncbi:hypothetical protein T4D_6806 [Trichinella pseudospiralis]|uniref:Uncharacterized protein n=1 Tax=Trichinella pseudospiralis TaxID=6337 RepID=A0A0V1FS99_TRIPS|nr:hypothetical protein T4D_6806 [Trichinella pseudospiralis]
MLKLNSVLHNIDTHYRYPCATHCQAKILSSIIISHQQGNNKALHFVGLYFRNFLILSQIYCHFLNIQCENLKIDNSNCSVQRCHFVIR